jgi:monoamine oxidase
VPAAEDLGSNTVAALAKELEADVVVAGGGLAGLAAAREATRSGAAVLMLEARGRVGGRTLNAELGDDKVVEIGGQWVGPTQDRLYELAAELGIETFPTYIDGENVLELGGKLRRYSGTIPRLNPVSLLEIELARRRLDALGRRIPLEAPWEAPGAARLDRTTLASWLRRTLHTGAARRLVEIAVNTVWGADPADLSLLYALWYMRSGGGFDSLLDTEGGAQQDRFHGGSQLISLRMAEELGDRVLLNAPVLRVEHGGERVRMIAGEVQVSARRAIVAMAPPLCDRIEWSPELPPARSQLAQRMPWGSYVKCLAVYDEPFWRADGLSGESVSDEGPATTTFDNSPPDGSPGILLGFSSGGDGRALQRLGENERREAVLRGLARVFGPRALRPERFIEQDWSRERFTGGGPVCFMGPGVWTGFGRAMRQPVGALHWAGTETSDVWSGYMDGAVRSGERAAREALQLL